MKIQVAVAQVAKEGSTSCGDSYELVKRPQGGVSVILAEGQGSGLSAHQISKWVAARTKEAIDKSVLDTSVARTVHDALYARGDRTESCKLTVLSLDTEEETLSVSRNTSSPTLVVTPEYDTVYDDIVEALGVHRHTKPHVYELPLEPGMLVVSYTAGLANAGKKQTGHKADTEKILRIIKENNVDDVSFIAQSILEYALSLDKDQAADDMTVVVIGAAEDDAAPLKIDTCTAVYPS